ncbi:MAG: AMP-binding protein [Lachnospiraceae bacterium]|nr:AMP-binding protein [Lachnospiraceae bacterium]
MEPLYTDYSTAAFDADGVLTDFTLHAPENFNFAYDVVDRIAEKEPEKRALVWCDTKGNEKTLSFGEISSLSVQAAGYLAANGVKKGDRVLLIMKRHYEYWYILPALHRMGAVVIPASHMLKKKDLVYRIQSAEISAIISADDSELTGNIIAAKESCPSLQHLFTVRKDYPGFLRLDLGLKEMPKSAKRIPTLASEPFLMYFTSGTTSYPKAVIHNGYYPLGHIPTAKYWHNCEDNGLHLTVADTGWAKASWGKIYGQWMCGCAIMAYDYEHFDAAQMFSVIKKYNVTSFCAPPTVYRLMVKNGIPADAFSCVRYATTAGEALNPEITKRFQDITGLLIHEGFGQSETTLLLGNLVNAPVKIGSIGKPNPLYDVRIVDEEGNEAGVDERGEIVVFPKPNQCGLCIGYLNSEEQDRRVWKNGVFHTGDIATRDADGFFWYIGRTDDIIKSSGYRIGPFEIEDVLIKHSAVAECAVTGVPDEERGFVVKATIVLMPGYTGTPELAQELKEYVKTQTAPYKYPRIIDFVPELPKTISGKIQRAKLREQDAADADTKL